MAEAVSKVLRTVFQNIGHMTPEEADEYFLHMQVTLYKIVSHLKLPTG